MSCSAACVRGLHAAAVGGQARAHVELADTRFQRAARPFARLDGGAHALAHAVLLLVDSLQSAADAPVQNAERAIDALLPQAALQHREAVAQRLRGLGARGGDAVEQFVARADHHLGGGGRRGRAQVGHEIGDGDVGLVSHGGDHRARSRRRWRAPRPLR